MPPALREWSRHLHLLQHWLQHLTHWRTHYFTWNIQHPLRYTRVHTQSVQQCLMSKIIAIVCHEVVTRGTKPFTVGDQPRLKFCLRFVGDTNFYNLHRLDSSCGAEYVGIVYLDAASEVVFFVEGEHAAVRYHVDCMVWAEELG